MRMRVWQRNHRQRGQCGERINAQGARDVERQKRSWQPAVLLGPQPRDPVAAEEEETNHGNAVERAGCRQTKPTEIMNSENKACEQQPHRPWREYGHDSPLPKLR